MTAEEQMDYLRSLLNRPRRISLNTAMELLQRRITAEALRPPPPTIEESIAKIRAIADQAGLEITQIRDARNDVAIGWMAEWEAAADAREGRNSSIIVGGTSAPAKPPKRL